MIREELILDLVKNKSVLDIGSVGQSDKYCLWDLLTERVDDLQGVDLPDSLDTVSDRFNLNSQDIEHSTDPRITYGNMEVVDLGRKFDVIVAGDVIEHVSNQGLFLDNIRKHLNSDGRLIITTPNAKWPTVFLKPNVTHTFWHDIFTLKCILTRHGFFVEDFRFYYGNKPRYNCLIRPLVWRQAIFCVAKIESC